MEGPVSRPRPFLAGVAFTVGAGDRGRRWPNTSKQCSQGLASDDLIGMERTVTSHHRVSLQGPFSMWGPAMPSVIIRQ